MKIVVGGQVDRQEIANKIKEIAGEKVKVEVMDDIQAATAIKSGNADYYFGAWTKFTENLKLILIFMIFGCKLR